MLRPRIAAALLVAFALPAGAQPVAAQLELSAEAVREVQVSASGTVDVE